MTSRLDELRSGFDSMIAIKAPTSIYSDCLTTIKRCLLLICLIWPAQLLAADESTKKKPTLTSSVSEEFRNGVHEKYLQYIANQLDMNLKIIPMTYNRRILSLENGTIDIMTGVRNTYDSKGKFEYLQPSYTSTASSFFIKTGSSIKLTNAEDLNGLVIATTVNEKSHVESLKRQGAEVVIIPRLAQKIKLLMLERIDAFEHVESSALSQIKTEGLDKEISLADYKTENNLKFHFAISTSSPYMAIKKDIESVIEIGVKSGAFEEIRAKHYQSEK